MNENKKYHDLTTIEKMYEHYLAMKTRYAKEPYSVDFLAITLIEKEEKTKVFDEMMVEVSKKILSLEEFKTAVIHSLLNNIEEGINSLSPREEIADFAAEDLIDRAIEGVMYG